MATEERVLCFKRELFERMGVFQGISFEVGKYMPEISRRENLLYLNRSEAEGDKSHKQLIPYVLVVCGGKILRYQRGKGGGEKRLHGLYSVGIGGHISEEDNGEAMAADNGYLAGMRRELMEEIATDKFDERMVALINDDATDVGQVHFGVVHVLQVPDEQIASEDSGINSPEFIPLSEAARDPSAYESWSKFCIENLDAILNKAASSGLAVPRGV